jgi:hypothetical protein
MIVNMRRETDGAAVEGAAVSPLPEAFCRDGEKNKAYQETASVCNAPSQAGSKLGLAGDV